MKSVWLREFVGIRQGLSPIILWSVFGVIGNPVCIRLLDLRHEDSEVGETGRGAAEQDTLS